jgi:hypothetical protein
VAAIIRFSVPVTVTMSVVMRAPFSRPRRAGARDDVAVLDMDRGAHRLQTLDVLVDRTRADRAAAGQRHPRFAEAREQRAEHEDRRAHRLDQLVGRLARCDASGVERDAATVASLRSATTPRLRSSFSAVLTSWSCGTLTSVTGSSVSSAAQSSGSAAFLAPEIATSPSSRRPPRMISLSMNDSGVRRLRPLGRRQRLHR